MYEENLRRMNISIPEAPRPAGAYVPVTRSGNLLFVSGQIPVRDGRLCHTGKVTASNIADAQDSARLCAINILAQLKSELKSLDMIQSIVKISGFVNAGPDFTEHPKVIDAASQLLFEIFGEDGRHARVAMGASGLPLDAMTEIDAIVMVKDSRTGTSG